MLGFVKKDLLLMSKNIKTLGLIFIVYLIMIIQNQMSVAILPAFFSVVLMITTFNYDAYNKWDAYAISMPNGRINMVKAKYIMSLVMIIMMSLLSIPTIFLNQTLDLKTLFNTILLTMFLMSCFLNIMYPVIFKYGIEKARIVIFVLVFGLVFIFKMLFNLINYLDFINWDNFFKIVSNYIYLVLPILLLLFTYFSYLISKKIYLKKEF